MEKLSDETDDLVCLRCPSDFVAVGQFYRDFDQVNDEEVRQLFSGRDGTAAVDTGKDRALD